MKAVMLNTFGNDQQLFIGNTEIPHLSADEVLIKLSFAGIGQWDIFEREGGYEALLNKKTKFPYILGSEGVGEIIETGKSVSHFKKGDIVNAVKFLNENGGFYADYVVVPEDAIYPKADYLSLEQAATISGVGMTAFKGIVDVLEIKENEDILIFGASGGVGHIAVQIAKSFGANVFAVASGKDGVNAISALGIEHVIDGKTSNAQECMSKFKIKDFDHAFFTSGGNLADELAQKVKELGKIVYPKGIKEIAAKNCKAEIKTYYADINSFLIKRFDEWVNDYKPVVIVEKVYDLENYIRAHQALEEHYVGKLCFKIS